MIVIIEADGILNYIQISHVHNHEHIKYNWLNKQFLCNFYAISMQLKQH